MERRIARSQLLRRGVGARDASSLRDSTDAIASSAIVLNAGAIAVTGFMEGKAAALVGSSMAGSIVSGKLSSPAHENRMPGGQKPSGKSSFG